MVTARALELHYLGLNPSSTPDKTFCIRQVYSVGFLQEIKNSLKLDNLKVFHNRIIQTNGQGVGKPQRIVHYPRSNNSGLCYPCKGPRDRERMVPRMATGEVNAQPHPLHLISYGCHSPNPTDATVQSRQPPGPTAEWKRNTPCYGPVPSSVKQPVDPTFFLGCHNDKRRWCP